jgi:hypothetical protein
LAASAIAAWNAQQPPSSEQQGMQYRFVVYWVIYMFQYYIKREILHKASNMSVYDIFRTVRNF